MPEDPTTLRHDDAVSPVIAVILMVAITVVLAATVYLWVSNFTDTGEPSPSANFRYEDCDPPNGTTFSLQSGGPLTLADLNALVYDSSNALVAEAEPIADSGSWSTGSRLTIANESHPGEDATWTEFYKTFEPGDEYSFDLVHTPSASTMVSVPFSC